MDETRGGGILVWYREALAKHISIIALSKFKSLTKKLPPRNNLDQIKTVENWRRSTEPQACTYSMAGSEGTL